MEGEEVGEWERVRGGRGWGRERMRRWGREKREGEGGAEGEGIDSGNDTTRNYRWENTFATHAHC